MENYYRDVNTIKVFLRKSNRYVYLAQPKVHVPDYPEYFVIKTFYERQQPIEIGIHKNLQNIDESILRLYDEWFDGQAYHMAIEYCENGDLHTWLDELRGTNIGLQCILNIAWQLSHTVQRMHSLSICHRDIKPLNIYMKQNKTMYKLGDFGEAKLVESNDYSYHTMTGTPFYMSPEQMKNFKLKMNLKVNPYRDDIWALGRTFVEISLCRLCPETLGMTIQQLHYFIDTEFANLEFPQIYSNMVKKMLTDTPNTLINVEQVKNEIMDMYNTWYSVPTYDYSQETHLDSTISKNQEEYESAFTEKLQEISNGDSLSQTSHEKDIDNIKPTILNSPPETKNQIVSNSDSDEESSNSSSDEEYSLIEKVGRHSVFRKEDSYQNEFSTGNPFRENKDPHPGNESVHQKEFSSTANLFTGYNNHVNRLSLPDSNPIKVLPSLKDARLSSEISISVEKTFGEHLSNSNKSSSYKTSNSIQQSNPQNLPFSNPSNLHSNAPQIFNVIQGPIIPPQQNNLIGGYQIPEIPIQRFNEEPLNNSQPVNPLNREPSICKICNKLCDGDSINTPCDHMFHAHCIKDKYEKDFIKLEKKSEEKKCPECPNNIPYCFFEKCSFFHAKARKNLQLQVYSTTAFYCPTDVKEYLKSNMLSRKFKAKTKKCNICNIKYCTFCSVPGGHRFFCDLLRDFKNDTFVKENYIKK